MSQELKTFTVNLKSLDQDIRDPIVAGSADAYGRIFRIIFDQEAAAQCVADTKVYLSWRHVQLDIKGYNVFTKVQDDPIVWEIVYPQAMLHEGDVLCCIELVDSVSIASSTNFTVHVLSDPNDGSAFVVSDDFSAFQNAVIHLTSLGDKMKTQMEEQRKEFEEWTKSTEEIKKIATDAYNKATTVENKLDQITISAEVKIQEFQLYGLLYIQEEFQTQQRRITINGGSRKHQENQFFPWF